MTRTKIERVEECIDAAEKLFGFDASRSVQVMIAAQMIQAERLHSTSPDIPEGKALMDIEAIDAWARVIKSLRAKLATKDDRIKVLEEALRSLQNFVRLDTPACSHDERSITATESFEAARMLCGLPHHADDAERGLASIREAAGVER